MSARLLVATLAVTLIAGCGDSTGVVPRNSSEVVPTRNPTPRATLPATLSHECLGQVEEFFSALQDLDSRLDVGLNFSSYSERVGDAKVAYDRIDITRLDAGCLSVAVKGENAFNAYADAYNTWNECISDVDCTTESIESELQRHWTTASELLSEIRAALP